MDESKAQLTVYFENPFWVGVFERITDNKLSVCKITFGTESKDFEVWKFILKEYCRLKFSPSVDAVVKNIAKNPKRLQRELRKQLASVGIGTKSQQALQLQREESKLIRKTIGRERRNAEKERRFNLRQQKRKEKHRGR